ncbi:high-molecular-weight cytochrome c [Desulfosarcina alkanivorans]|uniref:High-molecular-weight cytochrome c n=1 Tax=Desulfosarcina alkanivorans TaxID=571177 RepID=A0A5K7YM68_9BACT|nr:high-molecular-weight cytochrome c [Desulfosarcina alkanivorans]
MKTGGMLLAMAVIFLLAAGAVNVDSPVDRPIETGADLIIIDAMRSMGPLERPPVAFFHSRHTEALAKISRDCSACHMADEKGRLSPKYQRLADTDRQTVTDTYHVNCIACHRELAGPDRKSGPQTCGGCHQENPAVASTWKDLAFDKSLHYRHVKANDEKCESCHHTYDKQAKRLVYAKGEEGACAYCHKETAVENTPARKEASHFQCIGCHRDNQAKNKKAGPIGCLDCHDADYQMGIEVVKEIPRLKRNQPDAVLVKTGEAPRPDGGWPAAMNPVPFDHRAHETYNDSCKVCHHASLQSCASCHTSAGKKEGDHVKLAQAMHSVTAQASCIGCHQEKQKAPECAGCHAFIGQPVNNRQDPSCKACHMAPLPVGVNPANADETEAFAMVQLAARDVETKIFAADKIPEKVTIGRLSDRFQPAILPHGKIVNALVDKTRNSRLAGYYHSEAGTLCQGCHHHSPPAEKPPACSSCHGETIEGADAFRPGLAGAYHQQCIGCHQNMGIEKPDARDCNACHVEKNKG